MGDPQLIECARSRLDLGAVRDGEADVVETDPVLAELIVGHRSQPEQ
jgi:hypothetical protein